MDYSIKKTDKFKDQLIDILIYISNTFSKKEASEYLTYIEKMIDSIGQFPYVGIVPRYQPIAKQGYRAIVCKQNIIFYRVDEQKKEIILEIIVSSKRYYLNLI